MTVSFQNLAPANSVSFAPLRFGFNNGSFDAFNAGTTATAPIISIAEGGSGSAWIPAFRAADPTAVISAVAGPITPGSPIGSTTVRIDTAVNPYFTFAAMVLPSNDFFIGNDDPRALRLFDNAGNLLLSQVSQSASDIWNAGSEAFNPLNAAFLAIGNNDLRTPENGVVGLNFAELAGFNGLTTAAGYVFQSNLTAGTPIGRITFSAVQVPEPASAALLGGLLGSMVLAARRRRV